MPSNIFSELIVSCLNAEMGSNILYKPSSMITAEIKDNKDSVGLIPTLDLLKNRDLFISKRYGISFEGSLCNSYIYFKPKQEKIDRISLHGDVSSLEVILSKILFKEIYNTDINIEIITEELKTKNKNLILVGNKNFEENRFLSGLSFSEEVIEFLSLPFVNYIFASTDKGLVESLNSSLDGIESLVYETVEDYRFAGYLTDTAKEYIKANISSLILDFESNDVEGIEQLLRLPYYHGIINDIVEVKFV